MTLALLAYRTIGQVNGRLADTLVRGSRAERQRTARWRTGSGAAVAMADRTQAMSTISASVGPARTTSPTSLPIKARATGETYAIVPRAGSASSSPTI